MSIESVMLSKYLPHPFPHPSPLALNLSQHQGLFQWVSSSNQVAKYWHFSFSISPSYWIFRVDFLLGLNWFDHFIVQGTLNSLFQHHSSKASIVWHSAFLMVQLSHLYMTTGKTVALTICTFVCKLLSLLFNMLSMLVIAFLPRSKHLLISWLQSPSAVILEPKKIKSATVSIFSPSICHEMMGPDAMILVFCMLNFKVAFSLSSFTFIKRLFSSLPSAIRVIPSAYLRLLVFLPTVLIPAWDSSSLVFLMMYFASKLNKPSDNIQPWHAPFPILKQSIVPCLVLTFASWPAYRFHKRQVRWSGIPVSWEFSSLLWSAQKLWHSHGSRNVFLEFSCFFYDPTDVGNLISVASAFSKSSLNIWKFLKPSLKDFEHYLASMWSEHNCVVVWTFFGIALLWDWTENWPFLVLWPLLNFQNLLACWVQHFKSIIF